MIEITKAEKRSYEQKLEELEKRKAQAEEDIRIAKQKGDFSENTELAVATEARNNCEYEIGEIAALLRDAVVSDEVRDFEYFTEGAPVLLHITKDKKEYVRALRLVGIYGDTIRRKTLSRNSPIGSALLSGSTMSETSGKVYVDSNEIMFTAKVIKRGTESRIGLGTELVLDFGDGQVSEVVLDMPEDILVNKEHNENLLEIDSELGYLIYSEGEGEYTISDADGVSHKVSVSRKFSKGAQSVNSNNGDISSATV